MSYCISPLNHSPLPCTDFQGFKPSCMTVVEEPGKVLSRIHVARAFTEHQMDALIHGLHDAIEQWHPAVQAVSHLPSLFSGKDGRKLLEPLLERLKLLTGASGVITAVTSFGGSWYGDRLFASRADRVIRIEQPSKKLVRIIDAVSTISTLIQSGRGDGFELPYLHYRASLHDIEIQLGREKDLLPEWEGRSYFSYGRILYRPKGYLLAGRLHLDKSSFLFREGGQGIGQISEVRWE
jgi:hypothetical protein